MGEAMEAAADGVVTTADWAMARLAEARAMATAAVAPCRPGGEADPHAPGGWCALNATRLLGRAQAALATVRTALEEAEGRDERTLAEMSDVIGGYQTAVPPASEAWDPDRVVDWSEPELGRRLKEARAAGRV